MSVCASDIEDNDSIFHSCLWDLLFKEFLYSWFFHQFFASRIMLNEAPELQKSSQQTLSNFVIEVEVPYCFVICSN
jgi:hypothetical protein